MKTEEKFLSATKPDPTPQNADPTPKKAAKTKRIKIDKRTTPKNHQQVRKLMYYETQVTKFLKNQIGQAYTFEENLAQIIKFQSFAIIRKFSRSSKLGSAQLNKTRTAECVVLFLVSCAWLAGLGFWACFLCPFRLYCFLLCVCSK